MRLLNVGYNVEVCLRVDQSSMFSSEHIFFLHFLPLANFKLSLVKKNVSPRISSPVSHCLCLKIRSYLLLQQQKVTRITRSD